MIVERRAEPAGLGISLRHLRRVRGCRSYQEGHSTAPNLVMLQIRSSLWGVIQRTVVLLQRHPGSILGVLSRHAVVNRQKTRLTNQRTLLRAGISRVSLGFEPISGHVDSAGISTTIY